MEPPCQRKEWTPAPGAPCQRGEGTPSPGAPCQRGHHHLEPPVRQDTITWSPLYERRRDTVTAKKSQLPADERQKKTYQSRLARMNAVGAVDNLSAVEMESQVILKIRHSSIDFVLKMLLHFFCDKTIRFSACV